jgi:hypothetical protein
MNLTDDVRVFAGCLTGRRDWPLTSTIDVAAPRLASSLSHLVLVVVEVREHEPRPFQGLNRAQAAVIDGAVRVSLHLLPRAEIETELARLDIIISKTASAAEAETWCWLKDRAAQSFVSKAREQGLQAIPVIDLMGGAVVRGWAIARRTGLSHRRFRQPPTLSTSCTDFSQFIRFPLSLCRRSRGDRAKRRESPRASHSRRVSDCARGHRQRRSGPRSARGAHRHRLDPPVIGSKSRHDAALIGT